MRKLINAEVAIHTMKLQQMGAKVSVVNSKLCYIEFDLSGFKIQYSYNVNKRGNYYLERMEPYLMPLREVEEESGIVDLIRIDLEQFKDAIKSHNAADFIDTGRNIMKTLRKFEDLYLYYNVPKEEMAEMIETLNKFDKKIDEVKSKAKRIYFKKDPDNI